MSRTAQALGCHNHTPRRTQSLCEHLHSWTLMRFCVSRLGLCASDLSRSALSTIYKYIYVNKCIHAHFHTCANSCRVFAFAHLRDWLYFALFGWLLSVSVQDMLDLSRGIMFFDVYFCWLADEQPHFWNMRNSAAEDLLLRKTRNKYTSPRQVSTMGVSNGS